MCCVESPSLSGKSYSHCSRDPYGMNECYLEMHFLTQDIVNSREQISDDFFDELYMYASTCTGI